jgi:DHA2 family multidrug resistance protein
MMAGVYIVSDLGGDNLIGIYSVSFYSIGNAITIPLGKILGNRFGLARPLAGCLILFAICSYFCALAPNYLMFVIGRCLVGLASGPLYVLVMRALPQKGFVASINVTLFIAAPIIGAAFGGWIAYDYNWRWLFFINVPISLILAFWIWITLEDFSVRIKRLFDWRGYFFYAIGIFCLGFALTTGQQFDWFRSLLITIPFIIGVFFLPFSVIHTFYHPYPVMNFRLFKNKIFSFAVLNLGILFSAYFGMIILLALWLRLDANYTPLWIGALFACMAAVLFLPAILIHKKMHCDCRILLVLSLLFLAWSSFNTETFNVQINFGRIVFSRVLAGIGIALFLPAVFRMSYHTFSSKHTEKVVEIFQVVRSVFSGIGAALYTILWQRRFTFYHERLGSDLTAFSQKTQTFFANAKERGITGKTVYSQLDYFLQREANALALEECFYLMGLIMLGLLFLCLLTLFWRKEGFFPEKKNQPPPIVIK